MDRLSVIAQLHDALDWYKKTATWRDKPEEQIAEAKVELYPLIIAIAKNEVTSWWDDAPVVEMLQEVFPKDHDLWKLLKIKTVTRYGKAFEGGWCLPIQVKDKILGISSGAHELKPGHERTGIGLEGPYDRGNSRGAEIWRSAHDNRHWCYEFHIYEDHRDETRFQGTKHRSLKDVVAHIISWLTQFDRDDPDVLAGAETIVKTFGWQDEYSEEVLDASHRSIFGTSRRKK